MSMSLIRGVRRSEGEKYDKWAGVYSCKYAVTTTATGVVGCML